MADDTTKLSRSPGVDRENGGHDVDEDPLVELARIVSDDGPFFQSAPGKPVNSPQSGTRPDPFSTDLEAELMDEFEASFAGEVASVVDSAQADEPAPAPQVESVSEHARYTASDSQALGTMAAEAVTQPAEVISEVISTDYERSRVIDAVATDDRPSDPLADLPENPTVEPTVEPIEDPYRVALEDAIDSIATGEPHPGRFEAEFTEALADTDSPPLMEGFTPEFGVEAYGHQPELHSGQAIGDGPIADESDYSAPHYDDAATDGITDDSYESGPAMPPPVPSRAGGRKGLIAVAGVLAVVVLGGGVVAYVGKSAPNGPTMPVPVIKAESGDIKVVPDATDTAGTAPSVLDQLAGQQAKSEEKLIDRIEEPQQIARVVLPDPVGGNTTELNKPLAEQAKEEPSDSVTDAIGKTIDRIIQESGQDTGQPAATPTYDPIGPRKVRTVVVKADGTIMPNDDVTAPALSSLPAKPALPPLQTMEMASQDTAQAPKPTPVKTMDITSLPLPGDTTDIKDPSLQLTQVAIAEPPAPVMDAGEAMAPPTGAFPRPRPANVPDTVVARAPPRQATRSAARSTREPVNLLAAPAATDQPRVTASTRQSGYVVQVSSQRSADQAQASFADMQRRYNSVLGGFEANIQRADLGARGTFYRVRVGPMASRDAALRLCEQLKSAGGNCFVTR